MPAPHPRMHGLTHVTGGPDPVPGLLPASGTVNDVILGTTPGAYYKLNETTGDWADSADSHDMTYMARTGAVRGVAAELDEGDGARCVTVMGPNPAPALTTTAIGEVVSSFFEMAGTAPMTVSALVRPFDLSPAGSRSFGICGTANNPGGTTQGWGLYLLSESHGGTVRGKPCFRRRFGGGAEDEAIGPAPVVAGEWVRLTGVFDGASIGLWVDDTQVAGNTPTTPATLPAGKDTFFVGSVAVAEGTGGTHAPFQGEIDSVVVWDRAITADDIAHIVAGTVGEGWVLELDDNGNPVWVPPAGVTVNGDDPDSASTPLPTPAPPPTTPGSGTPDGDDWIVDQPFTVGGSTFTVQPKKWTTIPFTTPRVARNSNVTGLGTVWTDIEGTSDDPGWVDPADPAAILIPHDMEFLGNPVDWLQVCLRLDSPQVQPESYRALRIFETTRQKTLVQAEEIRHACCEEHGGVNVYTEGGTVGAPVYADGDTGGLDNSNHDNIMFVPNSGYGFYMNGNDWLPKDDVGNRILKQGMRLVAQVWHDATVALTFSCASSGSGHFGPYRPHLVVCKWVERAWGPPWSDWPTY